MRTLQAFRFNTRTFAVGDAYTVPLKDIPAKLGPLVGYLVGVLVRSNFSAIVQAGGGALNPIDLYNCAIANMEVRGPQGIHGPENLNGGDLMAIHAAHGKKMRKTPAGDAGIAAGATVARSLVTPYRYDAFGSEGRDFAAPIASLQDGGSVSISTGALPTNTTSLTGSQELIALIDYRDEYRTAAQLVSKRYDVTGTDNSRFPGGGYLLQALLRNAADWASGDLGDVTFDGDGMMVLNQVPIEDLQALRADLIHDDDEAEHFCDARGMATATYGTPRYQVIFPLDGADKDQRSLGRAPLASEWHLKYTGSESAANLKAIITRAIGLSSEESVRQLATTGVSPDALAPDKLRKLTGSKFAVGGPLASVIPTKWG